MSSATIDLSESVKDILVGVVDLHGERPLNKSQIDLDADFYDDLGLDSLAAVAFFVEIQRSSKVKVDDTRIPELRSVRLVVAHIEAQLEQRQQVTV